MEKILKKVFLIFNKVWQLLLLQLLERISTDTLKDELEKKSDINWVLVGILGSSKSL